jgi:hypothetical protein
MAIEYTNLFNCMALIFSKIGIFGLKIYSIWQPCVRSDEIMKGSRFYVSATAKVKKSSAKVNTLAHIYPPDSGAATSRLTTRLFPEIPKTTVPRTSFPGYYYVFPERHFLERP